MTRRAGECLVVGLISLLMLIPSPSLAGPGKKKGKKKAKSANSVKGSGASAEDSKSDAMTQKAKSHFNKGIKLFKQGEFEAALAEFETANQVQNHYITVFNIANTYLELGRYAEAMEKYEMCETMAGGDMKPNVKKGIAKGKDRLMQVLGIIKIDVNIPDFVVFVDGKEKSRIDTKYGEIYVAAGVHDIEIRKTGFPSVYRKVTVTGGDSFILSANLSDKVSFIIETDVPGATVSVNGSVMGKSPFKGFLEPGNYYVQVGAKDYEPYENNVSIVEDKTTVLEVDLYKPGEKLRQGWFWLAAGSSVLTGILAIGFGAAALQTEKDFDAIKQRIDDRDYTVLELPALQERGSKLVDKMDSYALACDINIGITSALAVSAVVLGIFTGFGKKESRAKVTIAFVDLFSTPGLALSWI